MCSAPALWGREGLYGHTTTAMHDMSTLTPPPLFHLENFRTMCGSEKVVANLGDRWWPQAAEKEGDKIDKKLFWNI